MKSKNLRQMLSRTFPRHIEIKIERHGEIWPVIGNTTQLDQLLMNLCVNARDAMPEGGEIRISLDARTADHRRSGDSRHKSQPAHPTHVSLASESAPRRYLALIVSARYARHYLT